MTTEALKQQLAALDDRMYQWATADDELFGRLNRQGMPIAEIVPAITSAREERIAGGTADPRLDLFALLDSLCDEYLTASTEERGAIRSAFSGKDRVLYGVGNYIARAAERLTGPEAAQWLRRGLAAASILDARLDEQDMMISLGRLYRAARQAGLDPAPEFQAVAAMSSGYRGRLGSMRSMLETFEQSDFFRDSVAPEL